MSCTAHSTAGNSCRLLCQSSMFANSSFFRQRTSSFVCSVGFPLFNHQQLRRQVNVSNGSASTFDTFRRSRDGARKTARSVGCSEMAVSIVCDVSSASPGSDSWSWNDMYWFTLNFGAALLEVLFLAHKSLLNSALGEAATVYIWTNCTLAPQGKSALCEQRADWTSDQRHGQCHLRDDDLRTRRARAAEYRRADFLPLFGGTRFSAEGRQPCPREELEASSATSRCTRSCTLIADVAWVFHCRQKRKCGHHHFVSDSSRAVFLSARCAYFVVFIVPRPFSLNDMPLPSQLHRWTPVRDLSNTVVGLID